MGDSQNLPLPMCTQAIPLLSGDLNPALVMPRSASRESDWPMVSIMAVWKTQVQHYKLKGLFCFVLFALSYGSNVPGKTRGK